MKKGTILVVGIGAVAALGVFYYMRKRNSGGPMMMTHPAAAMM